MVAVALIWAYILITTYIVGYGFLRFMYSWDCMKMAKTGQKASKPYINHFKESNIVCGIVIVTVYAQFFSLFAGVGLAANFLLVAVAVLILVYYRDDFFDEFLELKHSFTTGKNGIYYVLIFLVMAYATAHGIMHYDSDLYHAQAIHWIEDYGILKGLGNLHVRFAYNSSSFALSALYSFAFLGGKSYHTCAGFFALLLAWQCLDLKHIFRRGHIILSDFARLSALYYLFTVFDEIVAPASDYYLSTIVFYVIIHWLDMNVKHEKSYVPYIQLALLGVYAITVKLSAAPMIILSVIPIVKLLRGKTKEKKKAFCLSVLLAFIIVAPFIARNIIISGWLLYPVTAVDLFNVDFKIPKGLAQFDAMEIKTFGRGYNDVATYGNAPFSQWFPHWFSQINGLNKVMLILDAISIVIYMGILVYFLIVVVGKKTKLADRLGNNKIFELRHRSVVNIADFITLGGTLIGCLLFWLFSAPLIRYGVVYVWMTAAIVLGRVFIHLYNMLGKRVSAWIFRVFAALMCLWLVYKAANLVIEDIGRFDVKYLVDQQDYGTYEVSSFELGNETIYYPTEGDRIGYDYFPAATHNLTGEVSLIGENIQSGFKTISD